MRCVERQKEGQMAEPVTIAAAVITGLVGAYKAYTEYRAAVAKAKDEQQAEPAKSEEAAKGEQVAQLVKAGVEQHGNEDERADLANFERNPQRYGEGLARVLWDLAGREPAFAEQLQTVVQQAGVQGSGVQGNVNVSGEGKVYGTATGVNTGTVSGTYNFAEDKDKS
jgi:hypothetical protein